MEFPIGKKLFHLVINPGTSRCPTVDLELVQTTRNVNGTRHSGRDPFNQNSDRSDREKRTTSKGGPVFSKLFRLDRTDPLSFGPKFPEILVEWIAPSVRKFQPGKRAHLFRFSTFSGNFPVGRTDKTCSIYHRNGNSGNFD